MSGPLDEDWGELTPEQEAEQEEQLIRDIERRHPEWAGTVRNHFEWRRRLNALGEQLPDADEVQAELAELDDERRLTPAELLTLARDINRHAQRRIQRLIRRFDELTGFEPSQG